MIEIHPIDLYSTQEYSLQCQLSFHICYFKNIKLWIKFFCRNFIEDFQKVLEAMCV